MTPFEHSVLSVRDFGGLEKDYLDIHEFLDSTKGSFASWQHRAILHNSFGMLLCEKVFGATRTNSNGIQISVREIARKHITQDCNGIVPSIQDWLSELPNTKEFMNKPRKRDLDYLKVKLYNKPLPEGFLHPAEWFTTKFNNKI